MAARTPASTAARDASRLSVGHRGDRLLEALAGRLVPVVQDPETERLGQRQRRAGFSGVVAQQGVGVAEAGDSQAVLRLRVVDAVATRKMGARLEADVGASAQHLGGELERDLVPRPCQQVDREQRFATHGVDVGEGVGRGDAAPVVGVVHDRGEEVGGRDHRAATRPLVDPYGGTVVAVLEAHDEITDTGSSRGASGQVGQHALELTGRHLAGTATAGGVLGEPDVGELGGHAARLGARARTSPPPE